LALQIKRSSAKKQQMLSHFKWRAPADSASPNADRTSACTSLCTVVRLRFTNSGVLDLLKETFLAQRDALIAGGDLVLGVNLSAAQVGAAAPRIYADHVGVCARTSAGLARHPSALPRDTR
jgi:hypothetical protein